MKQNQQSAPPLAGQRVSIVLAIGANVPYDHNALRDCIRSAIEQDYLQTEVLVVDNRGPDAPADFLPMGTELDRVIHLPGTYTNRSAMYNAALRAASGDFLLAVYHSEAPVTLRRSAVRLMLLAATRDGPRAIDQAAVGMVYGDYERLDPHGTRSEVHLLDWHPGRCRETTDFGQAILYRTAVLRELGGWNESCAAADLYDLRLRIGERCRLVHVSNRFAGSLYTVAAPAAAHNVFDYLLAGRDAQVEVERVFTEHLRRVGAYLAPGAHVQRIDYTPEQEAGFRDCIASVVTPVWNRPQFIGRAIESVQAQTVRNIEMIVVVNGGPADPTADAVRRYQPGGDRHRPDAPPVRLIVVDINNLGLCLNAALAEARGKYYVQLDSDDRLKPDAIEKLLAVFDHDPTIGLVVGSYEVWTLDERDGTLHRNEEIPVVTHEEWTDDNGRNNLLRINGAGAPRAAHIQVIRELGWFGVNDSPAARNYGEDYDLVLRISERHAIGRVWEPIYEVIRHSGGTDHAIDAATIERNDNAKDHMRLEALRRRQAMNG